jgi:two-component system osmolarity sensor histidine kinase EnvZ
MSTLDTGLTFIRTASKRVSSASEWLAAGSRN